MPQVKESVEYLVKTKKRSIYAGPSVPQNLER